LRRRTAGDAEIDCAVEASYGGILQPFQHSRACDDVLSRVQALG
jgi:hypothetical protein